MVVGARGSPAADRCADSEPGGRGGSRWNPSGAGAAVSGSGKGERVTRDRLVRGRAAVTTSAPRRWDTRSALCSRAVSTLSCLAGHAGPQADGAAPHACLGRRGIGGGGAQEGTARRTSGEALRLHAEAARALHSPLRGPARLREGGKAPSHRCLQGGLNCV